MDCLIRRYLSSGIDKDIPIPRAVPLHARPGTVSEVVDRHLHRRSGALHADLILRCVYLYLISNSIFYSHEQRTRVRSGDSLR